MKYSTLQEQIDKFKKLTGLLNENLWPIISEFIQLGERKYLSRIVLADKEFYNELIKSGRLIVDQETGKVAKILLDQRTPQAVWEQLFRAPEMREAFEELLKNKGFSLTQITDPNFLPLINKFAGLKNGIDAYLQAAQKIIKQNIWGKIYTKVSDFFLEFLKELGHNWLTKSVYRQAYEASRPNLTVIETEFKKNFESIISKFSTGNSNIGDEMSAIEKSLGQLALRTDQEQVVLYKKWTQELKKDPRSYRLFDPSDPFYIMKDGTKNPTFREILKQFESADNVTARVNSLTSKWEGFKKLFTNPGKIGFFNKVGNVLHRIFNVGLFWDTRKWSELVQNRKALGWGRWIGKGLSDKITASVTVIPAILAIYKFMGAYMESYLKAMGYNPDLPLTDPMILSAYKDESTRIAAWGLILRDQYFESLGLRSDELKGLPAWSLDAYYLLDRYGGGFKPGDFDNRAKDLLKRARQNEIEIDSLGKSDERIADTLRKIDIPRIDTIAQQVDSLIKEGGLNPDDVIKK